MKWLKRRIIRQERLHEEERVQKVVEDRLIEAEKRLDALEAEVKNMKRITAA